MVIKDSSRRIPGIWCCMRIQNLSHTLSHLIPAKPCEGTNVRTQDEATAEGQMESDKARTHLDLLPLGSEHFPIYPDFEKYYYWL